MIDSVYWKDENYYPKVSLEKYNFNGNIKHSDEEYSVERVQMNKIQMKKIKCIGLCLKNARKLVSSYPEMQENFFREIYNIFRLFRLYKFSLEIWEYFF